MGKGKDEQVTRWVLKIKRLLKRTATAAVIAAACLVFPAGCGKKGPPVPANPFDASTPAPTMIRQTPAAPFTLPL
jgi:hypothetical protein